MEVDRRGAALLQEVAEKTKARKLKWQETAEEGVFVTSLGGKYAVRVFPYETLGLVGEHVGDFSLTLYEAEEMLLDVTPRSVDVSVDQLKWLYEVVAKQVYRVEEKNKSIEDAISLLRNL